MILLYLSFEFNDLSWPAKLSEFLHLVFADRNPDKKKVLNMFSAKFRIFGTYQFFEAFLLFAFTGK